MPNSKALRALVERLKDRAHDSAYSAFYRNGVSFALSEIETHLASSTDVEGWTPTLGKLTPAESLALSSGMRQWEGSLKRPDLQERDRVKGALEACLRMMFVAGLPLPESPSPEKEGRT